MRPTGRCAGRGATEALSAVASVLVAASWAAVARADSAPDVAVISTTTGPVSATPTVPDQRPGPFARVTPPDDPTGGAYTTPTLLFIPAGAVPTWNVRVITSLDMQGPTASDRLALDSTKLGFQPGIGGELGLPFRFTFAAGTNWVGGDPNTLPNFAGGLSPYFQLRFNILGNDDGRGFLLGTSATYKFVGFGTNGSAQPSQDPGEMEWAVSAQYRHRYFEVGLQGVIGKDFATTDADSEFHAYAVYRPVPQLAVGAATQVRIGLVASQPGDTKYDVLSGAIASLTLGRWQLAALGGESTVGLNQGQIGGLGEVFGTARF
jgi:hypothetical protein